VLTLQRSNCLNLKLLLRGNTINQSLTVGNYIGTRPPYLKWNPLVVVHLLSYNLNLQLLDDALNLAKAGLLDYHTALRQEQMGSLVILVTATMQPMLTTYYNSLNKAFLLVRSMLEALLLFVSLIFTRSVANPFSLNLFFPRFVFTFLLTVFNSEDGPAVPGSKQTPAPVPQAI
jgi:hypothetical protein